MMAMDVPVADCARIARANCARRAEKGSGLKACKWSGFMRFACVFDGGILALNLRQYVGIGIFNKSDDGVIKRDCIAWISPTKTLQMECSWAQPTLRLAMSTHLYKKTGRFLQTYPLFRTQHKTTTINVPKFWTKIVVRVQCGSQVVQRSLAWCNPQQFSRHP